MRVINESIRGLQIAGIGISIDKREVVDLIAGITAHVCETRSFTNKSIEIDTSQRYPFYKDPYHYRGSCEIRVTTAEAKELINALLTYKILEEDYA